MKHDSNISVTKSQIPLTQIYYPLMTYWYYNFPNENYIIIHPPLTAMQPDQNFFFYNNVSDFSLKEKKVRYKRYVSYLLSEKNQSGTFLSLWVSTIVCFWLRQTVTKIASFYFFYVFAKKTNFLNDKQVLYL